MISARVVNDNWTFDGVAVLFTLESEHEQRRIARFGDGSFECWETPEVNAQVTPSLRLPDEFARALLDALTRHYHGAEDTRALRRDYDLERGRVDQLIGTLSKIAEQAIEPEPPTISVERIGPPL